MAKKVWYESGGGVIREAGKGVIKCDDCPCDTEKVIETVGCNEFLNVCQDDIMAAELRVTISGVVDGDENCCDDINGTYILPAIGETFEGCGWRLTLDGPTHCGYTLITAAVTPFDFYVEADGSGFANLRIRWGMASFPGTPFDCVNVSESLIDTFSGTDCDNTNSTCIVEAVAT